jgi:hypothetical protein
MIETLLLSLGLAALSDEEKENEEDWAKRFAQIDTERSKYGFPQLTAPERMKIFLGQTCVNPRYALGLEGLDLPDHSGWGWAMSLYEACEPTLEVRYRFWMIPKGFQPVFLQPRFRSRQSERMSRWKRVCSIASQCWIPCHLSVGRWNDVQKISAEEYESQWRFQ